jgi:hypothetical protein
VNEKQHIKGRQLKPLPDFKGKEVAAPHHIFVTSDKLSPAHVLATFGRRIDTVSNHNLSIGLVVNAKGGSRIEEWEKGTHFYNEALRSARTAQESETLAL